MRSITRATSALALHSAARTSAGTCPAELGEGRLSCDLTWFGDHGVVLNASYCKAPQQQQGMAVLKLQQQRQKPRRAKWDGGKGWHSRRGKVDENWRAGFRRWRPHGRKAHRIDAWSIDTSWNELAGSLVPVGAS